MRRHDPADSPCVERRETSRSAGFGTLVHPPASYDLTPLQRASLSVQRRKLRRFEISRLLRPTAGNRSLYVAYNPTICRRPRLDPLRGRGAAMPTRHPTIRPTRPTPPPKGSCESKAGSKVKPCPKYLATQKANKTTCRNGGAVGRSGSYQTAAQTRTQTRFLPRQPQFIV